MRRARILWVALWPALAQAAEPAAVGPAGGLMGLVQVIAGLLVVLAAILGCAWLFRRLSSGMVGIPKYLRVVSAVMVGQRERVVIVEVDGQWLVLGVTPHAVNLLDSRPRPDSADSVSNPPVGEPFARWFKAALQRQRPAEDDKIQ